MSAPESTLPNAPSVGEPLDRLDGRLKVTGGARYAAEMPVTDVAHAVMVTSTIARGRITSMDASAAERAPGVLKVLTPFNAPPLPGAPKPGPQTPPPPVPPPQATGNAGGSLA